MTKIGKELGPVLLAIAIVATPAHALADSQDIEDAGNVLKIAIPATAGLVSLLADDHEGTAQLALSYVATMGTAYGLKEMVKEERPDHSGDDSFPSAATASAFVGAAYLDKRYGWKFGLPAYALAGFVGYSRVQADKHHWYDAAASAAIGWGFNQLITTNDEIGGVHVQPLLSTDAVGLNLSLDW